MTVKLHQLSILNSDQALKDVIMQTCLNEGLVVAKLFSATNKRLYMEGLEYDGEVRDFCLQFLDDRLIPAASRIPLLELKQSPLKSCGALNHDKFQQEPKICPDCFRNNQYVRRHWHLATNVRCEHHGTRLIDTCTCGRRLTYEEHDLKNMFRCECGRHWSQLTSVKIPEAHVSISLGTLNKMMSIFIRPWDIIINQMALEYSAIRNQHVAEFISFTCRYLTSGTFRQGFRNYLVQELFILDGAVKTKATICRRIAQRIKEAQEVIDSMIIAPTDHSFIPEEFTFLYGSLAPHTLLSRTQTIHYSRFIDQYRGTNDKEKPEHFIYHARRSDAKSSFGIAENDFEKLTRAGVINPIEKRGNAAADVFDIDADACHLPARQVKKNNFCISLIQAIHLKVHQMFGLRSWQLVNSIKDESVSCYQMRNDDHPHYHFDLAELYQQLDRQTLLRQHDFSLIECSKIFGVSEHQIQDICTILFVQIYKDAVTGAPFIKAPAIHAVLKMVHPINRLAKLLGVDNRSLPKIYKQVTGAVIGRLGGVPFVARSREFDDVVTKTLSQHIEMRHLPYRKGFNSKAHKQAKSEQKQQTLHNFANNLANAVHFMAFQQQVPSHQSLAFMDPQV